MATITRYYLADFGPRYTGLATVGYTLPGGSRTTSGVSELQSGTGVYGASITHDATLAGALQWDTGGVSPVYAFEAIEPSSTAASDSGGSGSVWVSPSGSDLCVDEDIAILDQVGYPDLVPPSQQVAASDDGVFEAGSRWTLSSDSVDFDGQGVQPGHVVRLTRPPEVFGTGLLCAVDAVASGSITLRRLGRAAGVGQPPAPAAGVEEVSFEILTFGPQITLESAEVRRAYDLDRLPDRELADLYEQGEELRRLTSLRVLRWAYTVNQVGKDSDGQARLTYVAKSLAELEARLTLRWGSTGETAQPETRFSRVRVR